MVFRYSKLICLKMKFNVVRSYNVILIANWNYKLSAAVRIRVCFYERCIANQTGNDACIGRLSNRIEQRAAHGNALSPISV